MKCTAVLAIRDLAFNADEKAQQFGPEISWEAGRKNINTNQYRLAFPQRPFGHRDRSLRLLKINLSKVALDVRFSANLYSVYSFSIS